MTSTGSKTSDLPVPCPWALHFANPSPPERNAIESFLTNPEEGKGGTLTPIKKGQHREVSRFVAPSVDLHIKRNRLHNLRAQLRRMIRPSKSKLEFDTLLELGQLKIPTVVPVAWAENQKGESLLFTRTIANAKTLEDLYSGHFRDMSSRTKGLVARKFGSLLATLHRLGLFHPDPHPGNLLWAGDLEPLRVMDLHQIKKATRVGPEKRAGDLAAWAFWSDLRLSTIDNLRFLKRYCAEYSNCKTERAEFRNWIARIQAILAAKQKRFWRDQAAFCLNGGHRRFSSFRFRGGAGMALGDKMDLLKEVALLPSPGEPLPNPVTVLKESKSSRVFRIGILGKDFIIKQVPWKKKWFGWVGRLLGFDPTRRSWYWTNALRLRLLPTPQALGVFHNNLKKYSVIVTVPVSGGLQLDEWVEQNQKDPKALKTMVLQLGRLIRKLHQRGVQHRDLKAANLLVDENGIAWLVDLAGVGPSPANQNEKEKKCKRDISRLATSFWSKPQITLSLRLRFLKTYLWGQKHPDRNWKSWWRALENTAGQRISRNLEKGRPLG